MRMLVTGRTGQLALALAEKAKDHPECEMTLLGRPEFDLEQPDAACRQILALRPDIVVNTAAYTAVDRAESEPQHAFAVNSDGAAAAARAAAELGVPFVHISTDYVFDGRKAEPYVETDGTGPLNVYGRSKLAGELAVRAAHPHALVLRTSWVFSPFGGNFVTTMLRMARERAAVSVVDDQIGNPTSALDLAAAILRIAPRLRGEPGGLHHLSGDGSTSWHGFASMVFAESAKHGGPRPRIEAITTRDYPTAAARPANSRLDCSTFANRFGFRLRGWKETLPEIVARCLSG